MRDPLATPGACAATAAAICSTQRREIERELRAGNILTVVSTNALELGIDIGQPRRLRYRGYPGTIASTWQQAGRAGRRGKSLMILVARPTPSTSTSSTTRTTSFGKSPERALIDPDNLYILLNHIKCAAYEAAL